MQIYVSLTASLWQKTAYFEIRLRNQNGAREERVFPNTTK